MGHSRQRTTSRASTEYQPREVHGAIIRSARRQRRDGECVARATVCSIERARALIRQPPSVHECGGVKTRHRCDLSRTRASLSTSGCLQVNASSANSHGQRHRTARMEVLCTWRVVALTCLSLRRSNLARSGFPSLAASSCRLRSPRSRVIDRVGVTKSHTLCFAFPALFLSSLRLPFLASTSPPPPFPVSSRTISLFLIRPVYVSLSPYSRQDDTSSPFPWVFQFHEVFYPSCVSRVTGT